MTREERGQCLRFVFEILLRAVPSLEELAAMLFPNDDEVQLGERVREIKRWKTGDTIPIAGSLAAIGRVMAHRVYPPLGTEEALSRLLVSLRDSSISRQDWMDLWDRRAEIYVNAQMLMALSRGPLEPLGDSLSGRFEGLYGPETAIVRVRAEGAKFVVKGPSGDELWVELEGEYLNLTLPPYWNALKCSPSNVPEEV